MSWEYSFYYRVFFLFPLVLIILCIIALIILACSTVRRSKRGSRSNKNFFLRDSIHFVILILFIVINCATLASGGIWLYSECESSAKISEGTITRIERVGKHEVHICIGDDIYIAAESGDLSSNDFVEYKYLPKSKFLLEIHKMNGDET